MKAILLSLGLFGCLTNAQSSQISSNFKPTEKIVNGDFSKNTCTKGFCIWNKSDYNNYLEGW
jgi:hypothetical protein